MDLMKSKLRCLCFLLAVFASGPLLALQAAPPAPPAETGELAGLVLDLGSGNTLNRVEIEVRPLGVKITSDLDGLFRIKLPPGTYTLVATREGYLTQTITGVRLTAGQETWQEVPIQPSQGVASTVIEVSASADEATNVALIQERKAAPTLSEAIGRTEMSRITGGDGADVMQRVTGISVVDNKFVFVRGLGERYSATELNGAQIPSTQPDKKVIAMDLFPSALLESIETEKSYTPDQAAEFAGGLVKVNTLDFPSRPTLRIGYGSDFNTHTTFKPFRNYPGGKYDFFGFDDGTRSLPDIIPSTKVIKATRFTPGFSAQEIQQFGRAFSDVWEFNTKNDAMPAQKFNFVAGNTFGNLGVVVALSHGTDYESRKEGRTFYGTETSDNLVFRAGYNFDLSTVSTRSAATANVAYRLTPGNKLIFRNFFTHDSSDEARSYEGFNRDINTQLRNIRLRFNEEQIYSNQLSGEHSLGLFGNSLLEWSVTRARSTFDEPDLRESLYEFDPARDQFVLSNQSQSGFRQFNNLAEELIEPKLNYSIFFFGKGVTGNIRIGASYRNRDRDFHSRRFRFIPINTQGIDISAGPDEILAPENIRPNGFELREETRNTDTYGAKQINRGFYGMLDIAFGSWRFIGGGRVESDGQRVVTYDNFRPEQVQVTTVLENTDFLPALNVVYKLSPSQNLRGSYSKTLNRPEFRELAPFDFTDVTGGRTLVGFPGLNIAHIRNYDVRWEWFPGGEDVISGSFFFKNFDQPIERVVEATAQLRTSYRNAEGARNWGFEADFRRNLGFLAEGLSPFSINANYTFVESNVTVPTGGLIQLTSSNRPLAGQSKHVFNGIFQWERQAGTVARALLNYQGDRLADVGANRLPDIIERGRWGLDAIFIQPFGAARQWTFKFSAKNLLNQEYLFSQGDKTQRSYNTGRTFSLSLSYSFFAER